MFFIFSPNYRIYLEVWQDLKLKQSQGFVLKSLELLDRQQVNITILVEESQLDGNSKLRLGPV